MTNDSMSRKPFSIPAHTHQVCGKPVRYFAPVNGSLDFPFVSLDDLLNAMPIPDDQKRIVADKLVIGEYADAVRVINTHGGQATIVPHYIYNGLIHAFTENGLISPRFGAQITIGSYSAFKNINKGMSAQERVSALFSIVKQDRDDDVAIEGGAA